MKKSNNKKGYTLIELIIVIGIFSLLIASITGFFVVTIRGKAKSQARIEAQEQARIVVDRIAYEIRRAKSVNALSKVNINLASSSGSTFILDVPATASSRNPTTFSVVNGILYMKYGTDTAIPLTSKDISITSLVFSNLTSANNRSKNVLVSMNVFKASPTGQTATDVNYPIETAIEIKGK